MNLFNAPNAPQAGGGYSQGVSVTAQELVFISGQIPVDTNDHVPGSFDQQARLVWQNILAQLDHVGMTGEHIVKVTTFLSDRSFREANSAIRREVLGNHAPALTVIICDIYDEAWLLEIEVIAAR